MASITFSSGKPRRLVALALSAIVSFLLVAHVWRSRDGLWRDSSPPSEPLAPEPEKPKFKLFGIEGLDATVEIASLNLQARPSEKAPALLQDLDASLPPFATVRLDGVEGEDNVARREEEIIARLAHESPPKTVTVDIGPPLPTPDASSILFGVATTLERLHDFLPSFRHWAAHTGARILVVCPPEGIDQPPEYTLRDTIALYKKNGIDLTLVPSEVGFIDRYVSLIRVLPQHLEANTKWVGIIDDDTFFFHMNGLLTMLGKYDTTQSYYVGALSENKWNINEGGISAVGGAGFFLTLPLLAQLEAHADACMALPNEFGDGRIADCIFEWTTTKMSVEYSLYQLDLHGDVTGFYEAVRPQPVSVHHWRTWHHHEIPTVAAVSEVCGKPCVLQKYRFRDDWRLANGFSIFKYTYSEAEVAMQLPAAMEHTWKHTIWVIPTSWKYSLAPLKPKDEGKIQYLIEKADVDEATGAVTSYYVRRENDVGKGIIRVTWSKELMSTEFA